MQDSLQWQWWVIVPVLLFLLIARLRAATGGTVDHTVAGWVLALPRGDTDTYTRAQQVRDALATRLREAAGTRAGVVVTPYESPRGSGDLWLRLEIVRTDPERPELSLRSVLVLSIDRFDFHRFEHVFNLRVSRGTYLRKVDGLIDLTDWDVEQLMAFCVGERPGFPWLEGRRLRQLYWQLWRPTNRIARVRRDWLDLLALWTGGVALVIGFAMLFDSGGPAVGLLLTLGGVAVIVGRWEWLRGRQTLVLNTGKPRTDPRALIRMDSWLVTLNGLGDRRGAVQASILGCLALHRPPGVTIGSEWVGYASVDSKVEREQHVVAFRRGIAFLRLEAYGPDLYVGWDSHVNAGVWQEQDIGRGSTASPGDRWWHAGSSRAGRHRASTT